MSSQPVLCVCWSVARQQFVPALRPAIPGAVGGTNTFSRLRQRQVLFFVPQSEQLGSGAPGAPAIPLGGATATSWNLVVRADI